MGKNLHVVPAGTRWAVKIEGIEAPVSKRQLLGICSDVIPGRDQQIGCDPAEVWSSLPSVGCEEAGAGAHLEDPSSRRDGSEQGFEPDRVNLGQGRLGGPDPTVLAQAGKAQVRSPGEAAASAPDVNRDPMRRALPGPRGSWPR